MAWDAILLEQREDYAEDEYARPDFQLTVINREQALRLYDEGKQIYLVRVSPWPILVKAREEIERGSDTFQIAIADLEQERNMTEQENMLLYGSEKQFGIYQITERDPEHDYRFMGLDYVEKKGITVTRADYDLIYAAPLTEKDTLDGIYGVMSNVRFDELELMLMAMFEQPTLKDTIQVLTEVQPLLAADAEMAALVQQTIPKMQQLNEQQFKGLELEWHRPEEPEKEKT